MSIQESVTSDASDVRGAVGIPKFVKIPAGLKKDENGGLVFDPETGDPIEETKTFYVKRTGKALKQIIERSSAEQVKTREALKREKDMSDDERSDFRTSQSKENIDFLYHGLSLILVDPVTDQNVDAEWLDQHLDFDVAAVWMDMFVPNTGGGEGNSAVNDSVSDPDLSTGTSTPELEQPGTEESIPTASTPSTGTREPI
jgi:hypothetical protein